MTAAAEIEKALGIREVIWSKNSSVHYSTPKGDDAWHLMVQEKDFVFTWKVFSGADKEMLFRVGGFVQTLLEAKIEAERNYRELRGKPQ